MARITNNPLIQVGSLTYLDYLLAAAQELGHAREDSEGNSLLPENKAELAQCRRIVDRALREFAMSLPNGWRILRRRVSFMLNPDGAGPSNISGDPTRYRMPRDFNGVAASSWQHGEGFGGSIAVVSQSEFDSLATGHGDFAGLPAFSTFRKLSAGDSESSGGSFWESVFHPAPSSMRTITLGYEAWVEGMALDNAIFQPGPPYNGLLEDMVIWVAARDARKPEDIIESRRARKDASLARAAAFDLRSGPAVIGDLRRNTFGYDDLDREHHRGITFKAG